MIEWSSVMCCDMLSIYDHWALKMESDFLCKCTCVFAVPECFKMVRYEAYLLVDLLPPFLKTYGYAIGPLNRGRSLSDETSAARVEIERLQMLTRGLNALQVVLVFTVPLC